MLPWGLLPCQQHPLLFTPVCCVLPTYGHHPTPRALQWIARHCGMLLPLLLLLYVLRVAETAPETVSCFNPEYGAHLMGSVYVHVHSRLRL